MKKNAYIFISAVAAVISISSLILACRGNNNLSKAEKQAINEKYKNISVIEGWQPDRDFMVYSFYFTSNNGNSVAAIRNILLKQGFIYKGLETDSKTGTLKLHMEQTEKYTADALRTEIMELKKLAKEQNEAEFSGWNMGPIVHQ